MGPGHGPTIMGIDVVMVGSILSAIATFAILVAIYAATTVRDPMAKRVKALNERREQLKAQTKLMQAGIRSKDLAFVVIFARLVLPIVIGGFAIVLVYVIDYFPEWGPFKRYGLVAGALILAYKAPDLWLKNKIDNRTNAIRKGLPDALDLLVICAE